jgi:hypothetical protein
MKTILILMLVLAFLTGCETYVTPGTRADLSGLAPPAIEAGFQREPSWPFPASVAAVRLQGPGYTNYNLGRQGGVYGDGNYTVVTTREVEQDADFARVLALPGVRALVPLNRLLLPSRLETLDSLREAASQLKADLVFVYTFDTAFFDEDKARVLSTLSLGFSPHRRITTTTTASALLMDTRSGYLYGAFETNAGTTRSASAWGSREAADTARLETEQAAFGKLIDAVVQSWPELMQDRPVNPSSPAESPVE